MRAWPEPGAAPQTHTSPASKGIRPRMIFIIVDLPAPLWPKSATRIPGPSSSETWSSASTPWNRLVRREIVRVDVIVISFCPTPRGLGFVSLDLGRDGDGQGSHQGRAVLDAARQGGEIGRAHV